MKRVLKDGRDVTWRYIEERDAQDTLDYLNQVGKESNFLSFGSEGPGLTLEMHLEDIKKIKNAKSFYLIFEVEKEIAGVVSIRVREDRKWLMHCGNLGITCLKKYWGLGLGNIMMESTIEETKARGLKKINLETREDNEVAIALYKKFGFKGEGLLSKNFLIDEIFYSTYLMGLEL